MAILQPMKIYMLNNQNKTKTIIASTWTIPMFLSIPMLVYTISQKTNINSNFGRIDRLFCFVNFPRDKLPLFIWLFFILYYALPLCVVSFTSCRIVFRLLQPISEAVLFSNTGRPGRKGIQKAKQQENKRKVILIL